MGVAGRWWEIRTCPPTAAAGAPSRTHQNFPPRTKRKVMGRLDSKAGGTDRHPSPPSVPRLRSLLPLSFPKAQKRFGTGGTGRERGFSCRPPPSVHPPPAGATSRPAAGGDGGVQFGLYTGIPLYSFMPEEPTRLSKAPPLLYLTGRCAEICIPFSCEFSHDTQILSLNQDFKKPNQTQPRLLSKQNG